MEVKYVADCANYKSTFGLMDFTDLIIRFANEADPDAATEDMFSDEAQDLSPTMGHSYKLDEKSERMYVAGDDDQAIYRWAGTDVDHFINSPVVQKFLNKATAFLRLLNVKRLPPAYKTGSKGLPTSAGTGADFACTGHPHNRHVRR